MRFALHAGAAAPHLLLLALAGVLEMGLTSAADTGLPRKSDLASREFFENKTLPHFEVELDPAEWDSLSRWPRKYALGRVSVGGQRFDAVGVRLKGTGTFQRISERPNLALKFNWKLPDQEYAGLTKIFLNNSRQDPSFLCEMAASAAYADGGVPSPRITLGRVRLNGRELGLCVVAEAVNKRFLKRHFKDSHGNLYEGVFRDIGAGLEQDNGERGDSSDIQALRDAASKSGRAERPDALAKVLDVERFLNFLAIEMMIANWDGFALHQNNYRIYHDPVSEQMSFIPHGLDNTFFESGLSLVPPRRSILVSALLGSAEDRAAFRDRVRALMPKVFDVAKIHARVDAAVEKMKQGATPSESQAIEERAAIFRERVVQRASHLSAELEERHPQTPRFDERGVAALVGWEPKPDWNHSAVGHGVVEGKPVLFIQATNGFCFSSWRLPVWLPAGRYRLEGLAATREVAGLPSMTGSGAGVRALGTMRGEGVTGSQVWSPIQQEFRVQAGCEWVELIAELRAYRGRTEFDAEKLRLTKLRP